MKIKKFEKVEIGRNNLKKDIWELFCSGDYPKKITTHRFLSLFLNKAKNTYFQYVSSYCSINWLEVDTLQSKLGVSESEMSHLFEVACSVKSTFKAEIQSGLLEESYNKFLSTVEEFSLGIVDDRINIYEGEIQQLKKRLVA